MWLGWASSTTASVIQVARPQPSGIPIRRSAHQRVRQPVEQLLHELAYIYGGIPRDHPDRTTRGGGLPPTARASTPPTAAQPPLSRATTAATCQFGRVGGANSSRRQWPGTRVGLFEPPAYAVAGTTTSVQMPTALVRWRLGPSLSLKYSKSDGLATISGYSRMNASPVG